MSVKTKGSLDALAVESAMGLVQVGVLGAEAAKPHPNSDLTVGELAAVHEFGLGGTPERSFVRDFVDENEAEAREKMRELTARVLMKKMSLPAACAKLGDYLAEGMKKRMDAGIAPALLQDSIRRKESHNPVPLEDTMTLRDSISYEWKTK